MLDAEAHREGTEEYITVFDGELIIHIQGQDYRLTSGDAIRFKADRPHTYSNPGSTVTRLSMTIYYPLKTYKRFSQRLYVFAYKILAKRLIPSRMTSGVAFV